MLTNKNSFTYDELVQAGNGELFGSEGPQLPLDNMLMVDRITNITKVAVNMARDKFLLNSI